MRAAMMIAMVAVVKKTTMAMSRRAKTHIRVAFTLLNEIQIDL